MSARDPTLAASDPRRSAWVAANAGAGKTHTLASRVARLLLAGARPERILCLTYTKAAAAEMQGRLFDQLGQWSMLPNAKLAAEIARIGAESEGPEQLRAARRLFAQALETPGGLKILTLHAFCQTVLSRFPIEAGIPSAFEVLDESAARAFIAAARQSVLERAGTGDARIATGLAHLVTETSEAQLHSLLDAALGNDRRKLDRFFAGLGEEPMAMAVRRAHGVGERETTESVARDFCAALKQETAQFRATRDWLAGEAAGETIARVLALDFSPEGFALLRGLLMTKDGGPRKKLAVKRLADARPDLLAFLETLQARFIDAEERLRATRAASLAEAALIVIGAVRREYARAKRFAGVLDYDDLIVFTGELLDKRDAGAWVLYKLDGGIDHVLVDEAQDTSPEQWAIVRKLTEEFFSGETDGRLRTLFAVGDEKQSIFSFQGADPAQFEINRRHFRTRAGEAGHDFADEPLRVSRRSTPDILAFIDRVFAGAAAREGLTSDAGEIRHEAHRADSKGRVEFWESYKPTESVELDYWRPVDVESESSPVARLADRIAGEIEGWIDRRMKLPGHERAIEPGDIMILLPRREPFGSEIIRQLKLRDIPVAGADRIALAEQIAAMDLIALGRFALLPEDDLNLAALLRSPLIGISEEELFALCHERVGGLWAALQARRGDAVFAAAHEFLSDMLGRADYAPPFEFYVHALTARGKRVRMLARLGADSADVIDEFLSLALAHEGGATPSLETFLDRVRRGGAEIRRDMERGRNQVRVMTVHGAKGLEADIVILPDTTSLPEPSTKKGHLLYSGGGVLFPLPDSDAPAAVKTAKEAALREALGEHRRLLYVALTRAKDRLYICGFEGKRGVRPGSWYALAQEAATTLGKPIRRGADEIHLFGEASEETAGAAAMAEGAPSDLPGWALVAPPPEAKPRLVRPSDLADAPEQAIFPPGDAKRFQRGLLIHALLAQLPETEPTKRHRIAEHYLKAKGVGSEEAASLIAETLAVLDDPEFAPVFAPGSKAEIGILAELGDGVRVHGRIDRLAVTKDAVWLVDFKTNRAPPVREADVSAAYLTQMALYRAALARIFPDKRIACALIWTDGPLLLRLSDEILDAQWKKVAARLDSEALT